MKKFYIWFLIFNNLFNKELTIKVWYEFSVEQPSWVAIKIKLKLEGKDSKFSQ